MAQRPEKIIVGEMRSAGVRGVLGADVRLDSWEEAARGGADNPGPTRVSYRHERR